MRQSTKALFAAIISNTAFGLSFLFVKLALDRAVPTVLLSIRFIAATLFLSLLLLSGKQKASFRGKPVGKLLVMSLIQPVFYYVCETRGVALTTASFSGVMIALIPVVGLILSVIFLREKCTVLQVICTILSVVGVVLTTTGGMGTFSLAGFLWLLGAVLSASVFTVLSRSLSNVFTPFERTYMMTAVGTVVFTLFALFYNRKDPSVWLAPLGDPVFWGAVLFLSLMCSVCGFLLLNYTINHLKVAHALVLANLVTVVSVLAGIFILGDSFTLSQLAGIAIIILSVFGVTWQSNRAEEVSHE